MVFGWLSGFQIDFQKEVDPWCKYTPKLLACDGTHIGVSVRNINLHNGGITSVDEPTRKVPSKHKRYDWIIISDRKAREHLKYMSMKVLKKLKEQDILHPEEEQAASIHLMQVVHNKFEDRLTNFISAFLQESETYDEKVLYAMGQFLYLLSGVPAFSTALPFRSHNIVRRAIQEMKTHGYMQETTRLELNKYSTECEKLLHMSSTHNTLEMSTNFIEYIIEKIELVHSVNNPVQQAEEIPNSYYPPGGTAYYFTESGSQVQKMPNYAVDGTSSRKKNYDDNPQVDKPCTKLYPLTAYGGFCYMFLFFCHVHGHSYGFHLIGVVRVIKTILCLVQIHAKYARRIVL